MSFRSRVFAACLLGIIGLSLANHTVIAKQLDDWRLVPHPQRITELYFAHSSQLPATVSRDESQHIAFIIHNIEYSTTAYHYRIIATPNDTDTDPVLGEGTVILTHDQYQTIDQIVQLHPTADTTNIKVELRYGSLMPGSKIASPQEQSINYHMNVKEL